MAYFPIEETIGETGGLVDRDHAWSRREELTTHSQEPNGKEFECAQIVVHLEQTEKIQTEELSVESMRQ